MDSRGSDALGRPVTVVDLEAVVDPCTADVRPSDVLAALDNEQRDALALLVGDRFDHVIGERYSAHLRREDRADFRAAVDLVCDFYAEEN